MIEALRTHWVEYLCEAGLLGTFMLAACGAVVGLHHPGSWAARRVTRPAVRRAAVGVLMGCTAVGLIYSGPGTRSGAHLNPGVTLTFLVLGKVAPWDAVFYAAAQFLGALGGVGVARLVFGRVLAHASVGYAATRPGRHGAWAAWGGEFVIAFLMMSMVLWTSNRADLAPYTGLFAGVLVAAFIAVEAPISGMSMNPARTLGSAAWARAYGGLWVYFTAPPLAMLAAAGAYVGARGVSEVYCAKLHHPHGGACVFRCRIAEMPGWDGRPGAAGGIQAGDAAR